MPVLVDGNNLLHTVRACDPQHPPSRASLCLWLAEWGRRKRTRIAIVFDGPRPRGAAAQQIGESGISVEFSGAGITADAVIIEKLNQDSAARRLTVISTDRAIARAARRRKAKAERSDEFWQRVVRDLAKPVRRRPREPSEKREGLTDEASRAWLAEFGFAEPPDEDEQPQ